MELEVTGCRDCKLCIANDMSGGFYCVIGKPGNYIDEDKNFLPIHPDWCELKTEPVIITLKEN